MFSKLKMPTKDQALPGHDEGMEVPDAHYVNGLRLTPPFPQGWNTRHLRDGVFLGRGEEFWQQPASTRRPFGIRRGSTPNPTYREVCSGGTGPARSSWWCSTRRRRLTTSS